MEKGNLSIRKVKESIWESLFHTCTDTFQFSLGLSCQATTFLCCHILGCQAIHSKVGNVFPRMMWGFPSMTHHPSANEPRKSLSHWGETCPSTLSASGQWIQRASKQSETVFFPGEVSVSILRTVTLPMAVLGEQVICHLSKQPLYMLTQSRGCVQSSQGRLRAAVLVCVLPATCWATQP